MSNTKVEETKVDKDESVPAATPTTAEKTIEETKTEPPALTLNLTEKPKRNFWETVDEIE